MINENKNNNEKIFTRDFLLITGALLFSALVMYPLMSTINQHSTTKG